jgi:hypothetical protein
MDNKIRDAAEKLFNSEYEKLTEQERHVAHHITERMDCTPAVRQIGLEKLARVYGF